MSYLDEVNSPKDIKKLNIDQLNELCGEIRQKMIETVSKNGGHLASNLGVVELTVALHMVFNSPTDQIVFDVGHQCYTHKILTGRKDEFDTLRTEGGISGFTRPVESEHDIFSSDLPRQKNFAAKRVRLSLLSVTVRLPADLLTRH